MMMMEINQVELSGYLAGKPAVRTLSSGTRVANARLGQTYAYRTKDGIHKHTNWFNLVFYNKLAQIAVAHEKGDHIHITGTLQQRVFTPKDGSRRTVYEVVVQRTFSALENRFGHAEKLPKAIEKLATREPIVSSNESPITAWDML
jgi:single stranded DNA-binding protein